MDAVFAQAIEAPWCYLEFGDVVVRDPARLDPRLRAAGLQHRADESASLGCAVTEASCLGARGFRVEGLQHSVPSCCATRAPTAAIFLALPANGSARNSINEQARCCGAVPGQSKRRTAAGRRRRRPSSAPTPALARVGGLLLIVVGLLGMLLLLGFIALRSAGGRAVQRLLPAARARRGARPGLRRAGRAVFRGWARASARRGRLEARVLVSARRGARGDGDPVGPDSARLVDAVAADVRVLVGRLRHAPSGLGVLDGRRRPSSQHRVRADAGPLRGG